MCISHYSKLFDTAIFPWRSSQCRHRMKCNEVCHQLRTHRFKVHFYCFDQRMFRMSHHIWSNYSMSSSCQSHPCRIDRSSIPSLQYLSVHWPWTYFRTPSSKFALYQLVARRIRDSWMSLTRGHPNKRGNSQDRLLCIWNMGSCKREGMS